MSVCVCVREKRSMTPKRKGNDEATGKCYENGSKLKWFTYESSRFGIDFNIKKANKALGAEPIYLKTLYDLWIMQNDNRILKSKVE